MKYLLRVCLAISLAGWFVLASMDVGTVYKCSGKPVHWTLPWAVLTFLGGTALLAWFAAVEYMTEKRK